MIAAKFQTFARPRHRVGVGRIPRNLRRTARRTCYAGESGASHGLFQSARGSRRSAHRTKGGL